MHEVHKLANGVIFVL